MRCCLGSMVGGVSAVCLGGISLGGCIEGFDATNGSDKAYHRLYDYQIDRPRVMGLAYWPILFSGGDTVVFEALAASPDDLASPRIEWWGCGVTREEPFVYYGTDCLESSLAEYLGEGASVSVTMPYYDTTSCLGDESCYGYIPVFAVAYAQEDMEPDRGHGVTFVSPDYLNQSPNAPLNTDLHEARLEFTMEGLSEGTVTAAPGDEVSLEARVETLETDLLFSWYVSAGELKAYGVTRADEVILDRIVPRNIVYGRNTLIIPQEIDAEQIYVYLTVNSVTYYYPGLQRFATGVIQLSNGVDP